MPNDSTNAAPPDAWTAAVPGGSPPAAETATTEESGEEKEYREELNGLAFISRLASTGGYRLRAFSYATTKAVDLFKLAFNSPKEWAALDSDTQADQVHALMFIQGAPLPEVERAARRFRKLRREQSPEAAWEDFMCETVAPFLATLGPDAQKDMLEQFAQMEEAGAAVVDARPPKGQARSRERLDPNS